jgi:hypothetical protein
VAFHDLPLQKAEPFDVVDLLHRDPGDAGAVSNGHRLGGLFVFDPDEKNVQMVAVNKLNSSALEHHHLPPAA